MEEYVIEHPICRVCLQSAVECVKMDSLMTNELGEEESLTYFECYQSCTQLDVEFEDDLPKHICSPCCSELRFSFEFITKARHSYESLLSRLEDVKPEFIFPETDSQGNDMTEATIYLPFHNMEEIFEEETDDIDVAYKQEKYEIEIKAKEDFEENESQDSVTFIADNFVLISEEEEQIEEINEDAEKTEERVLTPSLDIVKCNLCHLAFVKLDDLKEHGQREHESVLFSCPTCFHRFNTKYTLSEHMKRKHDETSVVCDICGVTVKRSVLRAHKRQVHKKTPFLCSACPRTFKTTTGLQIHSETHKENRQRKFECEHCHKKFLTERTYKVHTRTHWHREPFKCDLCDKQFMQKVNLRLHMQMHRGETMNCMYCDKKFVRKTDLSVHLRFHTGNFPYECQYCDKRFAIVSHLNYHQKRHQGYIYKCDVCDKEFINMSGLRNHSFQHTVMPFNCGVCDKGFPTKFKIKRHLKTVHHVEDIEELERFITTDRIKLEPNIEEINEEMLIEEADDELSVHV